MPVVSAVPASCTGLDSGRIKLQNVTVEGIPTQKSYSVDITLSNVSGQPVWLMYVDPVWLRDGQKNHIPLRASGLTRGMPRTDEINGSYVSRAGVKIDSSITTPLNLTFGPADQIGKTISISVPLVEASESNGKETVALLRLECENLPGR